MSSVLGEENIYKPRLTQPRMTAMLNNECGENSPIRDLFRSFFLGGDEQHAASRTHTHTHTFFCTHYDSWVVAADGDVLRPGGGCQAKNQDEHRHHQQQGRHHDGFPLPPFKGACGGHKRGWGGGMSLSSATDVKYSCSYSCLLSTRAP